MISAVVMAHPTRAEHAEHLAADLDVPIVWDRHNDVTETCYRALQTYDPGASHHLVLQDDVRPCRDLLAAVAAACRAAGDRPVSPYFGRCSPHDIMFSLLTHARAAGAPWVEHRGPRWGVAIAHPVALLPDILDCYRTLPHRQDDTRLQQAYGQLGTRCRYTVPSLVEHRSDLPSVTKPGYSGKWRVAHWFAGQDTSPAGIDWSGQVVTHETFRATARRKTR